MRTHSYGSKVQLPQSALIEVDLKKFKIYLAEQFLAKNLYHVGIQVLSLLNYSEAQLSDNDLQIIIVEFLRLYFLEKSLVSTSLPNLELIVARHFPNSFHALDRFVSVLKNTSNNIDLNQSLKIHISAAAEVARFFVYSCSAVVSANDIHLLGNMSRLVSYRYLQNNLVYQNTEADSLYTNNDATNQKDESSSSDNNNDLSSSDDLIIKAADHQDKLSSFGDSESVNTSTSASTNNSDEKNDAKKTSENLFHQLVREVIQRSLYTFDSLPDNLKKLDYKKATQIFQWQYIESVENYEYKQKLMLYLSGVSRKDSFAEAENKLVKTYCFLVLNNQNLPASLPEDFLALAGDVLTHKSFLKSNVKPVASLVFFPSEHTNNDLNNHYQSLLKKISKDINAWDRRAHNLDDKYTDRFLKILTAEKARNKTSAKYIDSSLGWKTAPLNILDAVIADLDVKIDEYDHRCENSKSPYKYKEITDLKVYCEAVRESISEEKNLIDFVSNINFIPEPPSIGAVAKEKFQELKLVFKDWAQYCPSNNKAKITASAKSINNIDYVIQKLNDKADVYAKRIATNQSRSNCFSSFFKTGCAAKEKLVATTALIKACEISKSGNIFEAVKHLETLPIPVKKALQQSSVFGAHLGDLYNQFKRVTKLSTDYWSKIDLS